METSMQAGKAPRSRALVIANRTAESPELIAALREHSAHCPSRFTLLVPAVPRGFAWVADMKADGPEAITRAEAGIQRMRISGLKVDGAIIGDPDPFAAAGDAIHGGEFDAVIVSTLPQGVSRWLRLSLPQRLRRITELPVIHITAHARPLPRSRGPQRIGVYP